LRLAGDVFASNQTGELRELFGPRKFIEYGAQDDEPENQSGGGKWRRLGPQRRHPAEQVGIPLQLLEGGHFGVSGTEISEEVAYDGRAVLTPGSRTEGRADGIDGPLKDGSQRMFHA
jgi:hypothetical protein